MLGLGRGYSLEPVYTQPLVQVSKVSTLATGAVRLQFIQIQTARTSLVGFRALDITVEVVVIELLVKWFKGSFDICRSAQPVVWIRSPETWMHSKKVAMQPTTVVPGKTLGSLCADSKIGRQNISWCPFVP